MKHWAMGLSLLGLGACSSVATKTDSSASDSTYVNASNDAAMNTSESSASAAGSSASGPARHARHSGAAYHASQFPEIAGAVIQKDGYVLNGYVFVRAERDWKELSKLLYGREDREAMLASWNANVELKPGTVVYYNSPFRPEDTTQLKSFDTDFGMTLTGVSVAAGDSLSSIAAKVYGNVDAWHELAALNSDLLKSPDRIEIGQTLRLASASRETTGVLQAYIQKVQTEASSALEKAAPQQIQDAQAPTLEKPAVSEAHPQAHPVSAAVEAKFWDKIPLKESMILLACLLAAAAGVAVYLRRRKQLADSNASGTIFFNSKKTGTDG